ncbi:hypothetical protein ACC687_38130, partial [Rhizobium ruizarguesonis]
MRLFSPASAAIFSAVLAVPASAAPASPAETFPGAPGVITLSVKCAKLVVAKFDATKGFKNELASVTLANGLERTLASFG